MTKLNKIRPMFNRIVTTADVYEEDQYSESGLVVATKGQYKEYQRVVSVGSIVKGIEPGNLVFIDPTRYIKRKYSENSIRDDFDKNPVVSIDIPRVILHDKEHFLLNDGDIVYVVEDYEEVSIAPPPGKSTLIKPKPQKIIL